MVRFGLLNVQNEVDWQNHISHLDILYIYIYVCVMLHVTPLIRSLVKGVAAHVSATQRAWLQIPKGSRPLQLSLLGRVGSSPDPVSF